MSDSWVSGRRFKYVTVHRGLQGFRMGTSRVCEHRVHGQDLLDFFKNKTKRIRMCKLCTGQACSRPARFLGGFQPGCSPVERVMF